MFRAVYNAHKNCDTARATRDCFAIIFMIIQRYSWSVFDPWFSAYIFVPRCISRSRSVIHNVYRRFVYPRLARREFLKCHFNEPCTHRDDKSWNRKPVTRNTWNELSSPVFTIFVKDAALLSLRKLSRDIYDSRVFLTHHITLIFHSLNRFENSSCLSVVSRIRR